MRREFPQSPERLWQMLTDPARLARWSPVVPDRALAYGRRELHDGYASEFRAQPRETRAFS